jgi:Uma2 family endonuclease
MQAAQLTWMSEAEFLAWTLAQPEKWELVDGVPIKRATRLMAGGTLRHARIAANIIIALGPKLRGGPCAAHTSDVLVKSRAALRYPDVIVDCGTDLSDQFGLIATAPRVLFEVLSPSNNALAQMRLAGDYQAIETVEQIVFVNQDGAEAQIWRRAANAWTVESITGLDGAIAAPTIGVTISMADIYDGVRFEPAT